MSRPVRYIAIALVVVLVAAAVWGIAVWSSRYDADTVDPGLYIKDKKVAEPGTMLTIGAYEVPFDEYRHYYLTLKASFEVYYGSSLWDDDPDGDKALILQDAVEAELVNLYAWLAIAAEYDITLSEEDLAEIQDTLQQQKDEYGDGFDAQLAAMFFTSEEAYLQVTEKQKLSEKAQTEYREMLLAQHEEEIVEEADAEFAANMISAKHILIMFNDEHDHEEEDHDHDAAVAEAEAAALARINEILWQIQASADPLHTFDEMMVTFSEDTGLATSPGGYTFGEGEMVDEFYQAALALEEGQISQPVRTDYGYHILLRLPLSEEAIAENRATVLDTEIGAMVDEKLAEVTETLPVVGGEYYAGLRVEDIR
ncbi:peptidylprolyl isomerase [Ruminococcaceae bacterium OttesenSCG-928-O06]|nr:peptidylprolyl isomerase [Ruminococcaceae bacterium OttesenSCG-928-O06]